MIQLLVNNKPQQLLGPLPKEVFSLMIVNIPVHPALIQPEMKKPVQEWMYNLSQSVINQITYNGTIIPKDEVQKPEHMN